MYIRMMRVEGAPDHVDQAATVWAQEVMPGLRQQPGFSGALLLADRTTGVGMSVTYWATEAALRASDQASDARRAQISAATGTRVLEVDRFELVVWQRSAPAQANTFIRINDIQGSPARIDDGIRFVREKVVPALTPLNGYRAIVMGVNRESGRVFVSTVWETPADRDASDAALSELRREGGQTLGADNVKVEHDEALFVELNVPATVGGA